jgi:hypothetical protein
VHIKERRPSNIQSHNMDNIILLRIILQAVRGEKSNRYSPRSPKIHDDLQKANACRSVKCRQDEKRYINDIVTKSLQNGI